MTTALRPAGRFRPFSTPPARPGPDVLLSWSLPQGTKGEPGDKGSAGLLGLRGLTGPRVSPAPGTHPESHGCPLGVGGFLASLAVHTGSVCSPRSAQSHRVAARAADRPAQGTVALGRSC